jgi:hypothetical protein
MTKDNQEPTTFSQYLEGVIQGIDQTKAQDEEVFSEIVSSVEGKITNLDTLVKSKKGSFLKILPDNNNITKYKNSITSFKNRLNNADEKEREKIRQELLDLESTVSQQHKGIGRQVLIDSLKYKVAAGLGILAIASGSLFAGYGSYPKINQTPEKIAGLERQVETTTQEYNTEQSKVRNLEAEKLRLEGEHEDFKKSLKGNNATIAQLTDEKQDLVARVGTLEEENENYKNQEVVIFGDMSVLRASEKDLTSRLSSATTTIEKRDDKLRELEQELINLKSSYEQKLGDEFEPRLAMLYTLAQEVSGERPENFSHAIAAIQSNRGAIVSSKREADTIYSAFKEIFETDAGSEEEVRAILEQNKEEILAARRNLESGRASFNEKIAIVTASKDSQISEVTTMLNAAKRQVEEITPKLARKSELLSAYQTSEREMIRLLKKAGHDVGSLDSFVERLRIEEEASRELTTEQKLEMFDQRFEDIFGTPPASPELALYAIERRLVREKAYVFDSEALNQETEEADFWREKVSLHAQKRDSALEIIAGIGPAVNERYLTHSNPEEVQIIENVNEGIPEPIASLDDFETKIKEEEKNELISLGSEVKDSRINDIEGLVNYFKHQIPEDERGRYKLSQLKQRYRGELNKLYALIFDKLNNQLPEESRAECNKEDFESLESKTGEVLAESIGWGSNTKLGNGFNVAVREINKFDIIVPNEEDKRYSLKKFSGVRPLKLDGFSNQQIAYLERKVEDMEHERYLTNKASKAILFELGELCVNLTLPTQVEEFNKILRNILKADQVIDFFREKIYLEGDRSKEGIKNEVSLRLEELYGEDWYESLEKKIAHTLRKVEKETFTQEERPDNLAQSCERISAIFTKHRDEFTKHSEEVDKFKQAQMPEGNYLEFLEYDLNPESYVFTNEMFIYKFAGREGVIDLEDYKLSDELQRKFKALGIPEKEGKEKVYLSEDDIFHIWDNGDIKVWAYTNEDEPKWTAHLINSNLEGKITDLRHDGENIYWTSPEGHNCAFRSKLSEDIAARINEYNEAKTAGDSEGRLRSDFSDLIRVYNVGEEPWNVRARLEARPSISTGFKNLGRSISSGANSVKEGFKWLINPFIPARNERGIFMNNRYGMSVNSLHANSLPPSLNALVGDAKDKEIETQRWYGPEISLTIPYNERVYFEIGGKLDMHGKIRGPNIIENGSNLRMKRRSEGKYRPFLTPFGKLIVQQYWLSKWLNARAALVCGVNPTQSNIHDTQRETLIKREGIREFIGLEIIKGNLWEYNDLGWYLGAEYAQSEVRTHGKDSNGNFVNESLSSMYGWGVSTGIVVEWPSPRPEIRNVYFQDKKDLSNWWSTDKQTADARIYFEIGSRFGGVEHSKTPQSFKDVLTNDFNKMDMRAHQLLALGLEFPSHSPLKIFADYGLGNAGIYGNENKFVTGLAGKPNLKSMMDINFGPTLGIELCNFKEFENYILQYGLRAGYRQVEYSIYDKNKETPRSNAKKIISGEGDRWRYSLNLEWKNLDHDWFNGRGMFLEISYDTERVNFARQNGFGNNAPDGNYKAYGWGLGFGYKIPLYPWYEKNKESNLYNNWD